MRVWRKRRSTNNNGADEDYDNTHEELDWTPYHQDPEQARVTKLVNNTYEMGENAVNNLMQMVDSNDTLRSMKQDSMKFISQHMNIPEVPRTSVRQDRNFLMDDDEESQTKEDMDTTGLDTTGLDTTGMDTTGMDTMDTSGTFLDDTQYMEEKDMAGHEDNNRFISLFQETLDRGKSVMFCTGYQEVCQPLDETVVSDEDLEDDEMLKIEIGLKDDNVIIDAGDLNEPLRTPSPSFE